nr:MAG TPA: hypothetical protein [Caudoviricetes sp.]
MKTVLNHDQVKILLFVHVCFHLIAFLIVQIYKYVLNYV